MDAAIAQEIAQKDVRDLGVNSHGENSSSNVNRVKRDNGSSRSRSSGRHLGRSGNQPRQIGDQKKRCFRCGLTNHTPDNCKYKDSECFKCHLTGHLQSECRNAKAPPKRSTGKQHVRHTGQDYGDEVPDDTEEEFLGSIFNLEEKRKLESRKSGLPAPAVKVPAQRATGNGLHYRLWLFVQNSMPLLYLEDPG